MNKDNKIPSNYWVGDGDCGNWNIYWETEEAKEILFLNRKAFYEKYYLLTHKYGMLLPSLDFYFKTLISQL
jgi:hypothetical protein